LEAAVAEYSMEYGANLTQFAVMVADMEKRYARTRYELRGMIIDETTEAEKVVLSSLDALYKRARAIGMQLPDSDPPLVEPIVSGLQAYRGLVASSMPAVMQERAASQAMEDIAVRLNKATASLYEAEMADLAQTLTSA